VVRFGCCREQGGTDSYRERWRYVRPSSWHTSMRRGERLSSRTRVFYVDATLDKQVDEITVVA
jgi:hypothetical protein